MKTHGDIPQHHEDLIKELVELSDFVMLNRYTLPNLSFSKCMVCIAHDYFAMDMEEEAEKYLKLADEHCPRYFMAPILCEMKKDYLFDELVSELSKNSFAKPTMVKLGFEYE
jgi:hypothetical protein